MPFWVGRTVSRAACISSQVVGGFRPAAYSRSER